VRFNSWLSAAAAAGALAGKIGKVEKRKGNSSGRPHL